MAFAALDGLFDVQRTDDPVLGGADGQVNEAGAADGDGQNLAGGNPIAAFVAVSGWNIRIAAEVTVRYDVDLRQEEGQRARRGAFGGAALAAYQHPADLRMDGVQNQRAFHALLADDARKWENS